MSDQARADATAAVTAMVLRPGARHFLAQRKAQGIQGVTDAQADALAALMVVKSAVSLAHGDTASPDVPRGGTPGTRGDLSGEAA